MAAQVPKSLDSPAPTSSVKPSPGGPPTQQPPPPPISIVLTFDDGPHAASGTQNHTSEIVAELKKRDIVGAFFIQTHVAYRFASSGGRAASLNASKAGHVIAIHTGSQADHVDHTIRASEPPYDVDGDQQPDGSNALESDLIRAKAVITQVIGVTPLFVRAVGLHRNAAVNDTYKRVGLKHIGVNADSKDNESPRPAAPVVVSTLMFGPNSVTNAIQGGAPHLIVLFHDINPITSKNIGQYIDTIDKAARVAGRTAAFTATTNDVLTILNTTKI
jgi:peptidoglycan/xylan/chitin deacetylase (PgdA/CDA1 family)